MSAMDFKYWETRSGNANADDSGSEPRVEIVVVTFPLHQVGTAGGSGGSGGLLYGLLENALLCEQLAISLS